MNSEMTTLDKAAPGRNPKQNKPLRQKTYRQQGCDAAAPPLR
jgi:hypothetical protein